ncbi:solute/DNA competence effector [Aeromonas encheleia]|jgi:ProP effector|uniref:RNA chaperone ProQ n=1 Tax=Aeromonas encheleia TaxID=73010 RepID=A0AAE9SDF8_9GAMM|nr:MULTISPECIES: RNA chaperone ProQ [Aeromonas]MBV7415155.1 RNA chaperone ProQ [Aeromonas sp. sif2433]MBV7437648.1 RNA chaperone ProQ [Aeromonas sp. sif2416]MBV7597919.1 RNA chaperone ProQ [Aeromonas sp. sia0103]UNP90120.1 RNA chaperone ProQ [Aeromonas encheleia]USV59363.1 RNA chaperone ProQ [Aeromonas encheleia]
MENTEKLKNSKEIVAYLVEKFPACFIAEGEAKPLKIGIFQDLAARLADDDRVSKTMLRSALRQYTSSWRYLHGLKAGQARVDLDGNPGELLTEEHIEHAKQALKESKERVFASRRTNTKEKEDKPKQPRRPAPRKADAARSDKPKAAPKAAPVAEAPLVKVDAATLKVDQGVRVVLGKNPVPATIKEVTKDDVQVQLQTGMMLRVKFEHLVL